MGDMEVLPGSWWHSAGVHGMALTGEKTFPSPKHSRLNLPFPCFLGTDHLCY